MPSYVPRKRRPNVGQYFVPFISEKNEKEVEIGAIWEAKVKPIVVSQGILSQARLVSFNGHGRPIVTTLVCYHLLFLAHNTGEKTGVPLNLRRVMLLPANKRATRGKFVLEMTDRIWGLYRINL